MAYALQFDGTNSIVIPGAADLDLINTTGWTIWFRAKVLDNSGTSVNAFLDIEDGSFLADYAMLAIGNASHATSYVRDSFHASLKDHATNAKSIYAPAATIPNTDYVTYFISHDATTVYAGFCENGGTVSQLSESSTVVNILGKRWFIGAKTDGSLPLKAGTLIESFGVSAGKMTDAEIEAVASGTAFDATTATVVRYYEMNEGSGGVINDKANVGNAAYQGAFTGLTWVNLGGGADNLIAHIYAEAGDSAITDKAGSGTLSGSGTASIVNVDGQYAWNLTAASYEMSFPSRAVNPAGASSVDGVSFAFRYRLNVMGANDFASIAGISTNAPAERLSFQRNGSASTRVRYSTSTTGTDADLAGTGAVKCVVVVYRPNELATSADYLRCWKNTVGRSGNAPDFGATGFTGSSETFDRLFFKAPDTMNIDLLDFVYWDRSLTDAEAAAVADDLRAQLPTGGASDTTPPTFSVAPVISAITQAAVDLDATIDETGDIHWVVVPQADPAPTIVNIQAGQANGGGAAIASGSALAGTVLDTQITGLTAGTAYAAYLVARDDEATPNVQASATQVNFSTTAAGAGATVSTSPFTNEAGSPLKAQIIDRLTFYNFDDASLALTLTNITTDGVTGDYSVTSPNLASGGLYVAVGIVGTEVGIKRVQAV